MLERDLRAHLDERWALLKIETFEEIGSTNTYAKEQAAVDPSAALYVANAQTAGRGRFGRRFYSPKETGVYFSLSMPWNQSLEEVMLLTPAAAVAVSQSIEKLFGVEAKIKWVNDIFVGEKKVCGILSESVISTDAKVSQVVVGIGINLENPKTGFPEEIQNVAGSVLSADSPLLADDLKARLVADIVNRFGRVIPQLSSRGFMDHYRARSLLQGLDVSLSDGREGVVVDIDDDAGLVVEGEYGVFTVHSGEASAQKKKRKPDT